MSRNRTLRALGVMIGCGLFIALALFLAGIQPLRPVVEQGVKVGDPASTPGFPLQDPSAAEAGLPRIEALPAADDHGTGGLIVQLIDGAWAGMGRPLADENLELRHPKGIELPRDLHWKRTDALGLAAWDGLQPAVYLVLLPGREYRRVEVRAGETRHLVFTARERIILEGVVLGRDGRPVSGASIWISEYNNRTQGTIRAETDGEGVFGLETLLEAGRYISAFAAGHGPSEPLLIRNEGMARSPIELVLGDKAEEAVARGRVIGEDGSGLAGARVTISQHALAERRPGALQQYELPVREEWTDADGKFAVEGLARAMVRLSVMLPGYQTTKMTLTPRELEYQPTVVQLFRARPLIGIVLDDRGLGVDGVSVGFGRYGDPAGEIVVTAPDGRFLLTRAPAVPFELVAAKRGFQKVSIMMPAEAERGARVTVLLPGRGNCEIAGQVDPRLDDRGGEWIIVATALDDEGRRGTSERVLCQEGRFRLESWPEGPTQLTIFSGSIYSVPIHTVTVAVHASDRATEANLQIPKERQGLTRVTGVLVPLDGPEILYGVTVQARRLDQGTAEILDLNVDSGVFEGTLGSWGTWVVQVVDQHHTLLWNRSADLSGVADLDLGAIRLGIAGSLVLKGPSAPHGPVAVQVRSTGGRVQEDVNLGDAEKVLSLQPGDYIVTASSPSIGTVLRATRIRPGEQSLVQFESLGKVVVSLYLRTQGLRPREVFRVLIRDDRGDRLLDRMLLAGPGRTFLGWFGIGEYSVFLSAKGRGEVVRELQLDGNEPEAGSLLVIDATEFE